MTGRHLDKGKAGTLVIAIRIGENLSADDVVDMVNDLDGEIILKMLGTHKNPVDFQQKAVSFPSSQLFYHDNLHIFE